MRNEMSPVTKLMVWDGVEAVQKFCVDVWVVLVLFAGGIVLDIEELIVEVVCVSYSVFRIVAVPDISQGSIACGERVSTFDLLDAACC
jgi:hypothetical protein